MNRAVRSLLLGVGGLAAVAGVAAVAGLVGGPAAPGAARGTPQDKAGPAPTTPPAAKLKVRLGKAGPGDTLDPGHSGWEAVPPTQVLLNRTPRVYQTEKPAPAGPTSVEVRAVRADRGVTFRLVWTDATRNAPEAPPKLQGEAGSPDKLYKRPTGQTNTFPDAAAVMVPEAYRGGDFPSLVMGDGHGPVRLYYWNASRGAEQLTASGRAHVERTGQAFRHRAKYADGRWAVTLEVPELAAPYPVAFAIWDGEAGDRDGLKMFSIWYVLE